MSRIHSGMLRCLGLFVLALSLIQSSICHGDEKPAEPLDARATQKRVEDLFQKLCNCNVSRKQGYDEADRIESMIEKIGIEAVPVLLKEVNLKDKERCFAAIACLHGCRRGMELLPREVAAPLIAVLEGTNDPRLCGAALRALHHCHFKWAKDHPKLLARFLRHPDAIVRTEGVIAAQCLQQEGKQWLPSILDILKHDPNSNTRNEAARSLLHLAPGDPTVINILIEQLDGPAERGALWALAFSGQAAKPAIPAILKKAKMRDDDAIRALGRLGSVAKEAIPTLVELLDTKEKHATDTARVIVAIGKIEPESPMVINAMRQVLREEVAGVKNEPRLIVVAAKLKAIRVLAKGGRNARAALPELTKCLNDESSLLRSESAAAMRVIADDVPQASPTPTKPTVKSDAKQPKPNQN